MNLKEQTVKKIYKFKGQIINVRQDEALTCDGRPCSREVIEHPGGVSIIAFNDKNELFLVKQYRYPIEQFAEAMHMADKRPEPVLKVMMYF